jgi:hypothetical protein
MEEEAEKPMHATVPEALAALIAFRSQKGLPADLPAVNPARNPTLTLQEMQYQAMLRDTPFTEEEMKTKEADVIFQRGSTVLMGDSWDDGNDKKTNERPKPVPTPSRAVQPPPPKQMPAPKTEKSDVIDLDACDSSTSNEAVATDVSNQTKAASSVAKATPSVAKAASPVAKAAEPTTKAVVPTPAAPATEAAVPAVGQTASPAKATAPAASPPAKAAAPPTPAPVAKAAAPERAAPMAKSAAVAVAPAPNTVSFPASSASADPSRSRGIKKMDMPEMTVAAGAPCP